MEEGKTRALKTEKKKKTTPHTHPRSLYANLHNSPQRVRDHQQIHAKVSKSTKEDAQVDPC